MAVSGFQIDELGSDPENPILRGSSQVGQRVRAWRAGLPTLDHGPDLGQLPLEGFQLIIFLLITAFSGSDPLLSETFEPLNLFKLNLFVSEDLAFLFSVLRDEGVEVQFYDLAMTIKNDRPICAGDTIEFDSFLLSNKHAGPGRDPRDRDHR